MVEKWLLQVQQTMILSLKDVMMKAVTAYDEVPRGKWVLEWPGQVVIAASTVHWTTDVSKAIEQGTLKVWLWEIFWISYIKVNGIFYTQVFHCKCDSIFS